MARRCSTRDHLSRLIVALVREELDLSAIVGSYRSGLGQPPFDPWMMTALLLHAYASGLYSSRRIAKATVERADFMMIVAGDPRDFRTISEFRRRHLAALATLFVQVLRLGARSALTSPPRRGQTQHHRAAYPGHARQAQASRMAKQVPAQKTSRRAGVRTNQTGKGFQAVPVARYRESENRMGADLHRPQSHQARPSGMNSLSFMQQSNPRPIWTGS